MKKIYLDACIIIYIVEKHPVYSARIEKMMNAMSSSEFCCSPWSRLECLVMPFRSKDLQLQKLYELFFKAQKNLLIVPLIFDEAARLRASFAAVKTPDALHLAAAIHYNCDEFWTNDNRLDKIAPTLVKNILKT
ncbi:MAG: type II toxin-antitoxin system VapC family toxin [Acidobacteriota bacterium]